MTTPVAVGINQAAHMYGVSPDVIRQACKATETNGGVKARKLGTRWSIRIEDLEAWYTTRPTESEQAAS